MTKTSLAMLNLDITTFICDMPGFAMIKDLNSNYLFANINTVNEFGLKSSDHLHGYSDLTIPHPLSHNGQLYRNLDLEVIRTGETMKGVCTFPFQGVIRPYHFRKSTLKDIHGHTLATYSHAQECTDPILIQFIHYLTHNPLFKCKNTKANTTSSFILNKDYEGLQLTSLESCCLFFTIRRQSISEMARLLNVSVGIIRSSIENIKTQLNARCNYDLYDIALEKGYINLVPPGIVSLLYRTTDLSLLPNTLHKDNSVKIKHHNNSKLKYSNQLTSRELDCARLLMTGKKIKEIAKSINLSPRTVETHLNNLKMKLACRDKIELVIKLKDMIL